MATLEEVLNDQLKDSPNKDDNDDAGIIRSTLSGIVSGVIKIPEGAFSLGASLIDLGLGTNTAAKVEQAFDFINPFEEAAEDTAAGRIAELIVNIGVPGGIAFKAGKNLAKTALSAKKAGKYFSLTGKGLADDVISKGIPKATKFNVSPINKAVENFALNKKGKFLEYAGGAGLSAVAEGVFVGDVKTAGTLGDVIGGPTKLNREEGGTNRQQAAKELVNRLKFGTEGGVFTAGIGTLGVGFNRLRKGPSDTGRVIKDPMEKFWNNLFSKFSKRGPKGQTTFEATEAIRTGTSADEMLSINSAKVIDDELFKLYDTNQKFFTSEDTFQQLAKKKKALNETVLSGLDNPNYYDKQLSAAGRESGFTLDEILEGGVLKNEKGKILDNSKLVEDGFTLKFNNITDEGFEPFAKEITENTTGYGKGAPTKEVLETARLQMDGMRNRFGDLFSIYGRQLDPNSLKQFKGAFGKKVSDFMDSGSKIFKNKTVGSLEIYPPSRPLINEVSDEVLKATDSLGLNLSRGDVESIVDNIYNSATLEKGFDYKKYDRSGTFFKRLPRFFTSTQQSLQDAIANPRFRKPNLTQISEGNLTDIKNVILPDGSEFNRADILKKLIGKSDDGLNTIITGTQRLSNLVRRGEINNEVIKNSARQKKLVDEWLDSVAKNGEEATIARLGVRPTAPTVVDTAEDALKYFGGTQGKMGTGSTKSTGDFVEMRFDMDQAPIPGVQRLNVTPRKIIEGEASESLTNNLAGKYALTGNAEALVKGDILSSGKGLPYEIYKYSFLLPKAGAQMAKTVLGPVTHARNFLSAMAFAGANGVLLNNDLKALQTAWDTSLGPAIWKGKKPSIEGTALYDKLLKLGVVNSNVSQGDLNRLLKDVNFGDVLGNIENRSINNVINNFSRIKRFAQDAYTAEDDFWKIFTWLGEKTRLEKSLTDITNSKGLALGDDIIQVLDNGLTRKIGTFNEEFLEKRAADLVKNNVPNYAYVSDFVKGIRKWPVGNFVSFPAEIMRTSTNIVDTALREINFKLKLPSGEIVKPFANIGKQRLRGMALTTVAVPTALVTAGQMVYDVTKDEINALRRYVPKWSKNSTLIPLRNEDGTLSYIDFSHMNAYDLLLAPIQSVINNVEAGRTDNNGIMGDFISGLAEATKELGAPFVTASLWTEAVQDVAPPLLLGRGGVDADGRRIWNSNDTAGNKVWAAVKNVMTALAPLNASQLNRLRLSIKGAVDDDDPDRFNKYGKEFTLGKELLGMVGLRQIDVDPGEAIKYKINAFQKNVRNSRSLFTGTTLRGGPETPEDLIDAYINANRALFLSNRELYKDIEAARELGISEDALASTMKERGANTAYRYLSQGLFKPYTISRNVRKLFQLNSEKIGVANPLDAAGDVMASIANQLSSTSIVSGEFPVIENPFKDMPKATIEPVEGIIPPGVAGTTPYLDGIGVQSSPFESLPLPKKVDQINTVDDFLKQNN